MSRHSIKHVDGLLPFGVNGWKDCDRAIELHTRLFWTILKHHSSMKIKQKNKRTKRRKRGRELSEAKPRDRRQRGRTAAEKQEQCSAGGPH